MEIAIIDTGFFHADGGAMFGAIPKTAWERRYPADASNRCVLAMRSLLILTDDERIILIDTGAGDKQKKALSYYRFFDCIDLNETLTQRGISPTDVTDVVLTHLHFDHCGDCTREENGKFKITYPNARHWVSRSQWENFLQPHDLEKTSYFPENMLPVEKAGQLHLIESDTWLTPEVELRIYDGHTPGQIVTYIHHPEQTYLFAGDVIPLAASVSPEWISAYDLSPLLSYTGKIRLLEEAARKKQAIIFCHDASQPCAAIRKAGKFFKAADHKLVFIP